MGKFRNESELAAAVVAWCADQQWEIYQEVQVQEYGQIADIVALQSSTAWVIEAKLSLSLALLEQAIYWTRFAHYTSIAVPESARKRRGWRAVFSLTHKHGIGICQVEKVTETRYTVTESLAPRINRQAQDKILRGCLREEHKTFAVAGNANGKRWSPYLATCRDLAEYVRRHPGTPLKEAIESIKHHYSCSATARRSLAHWMKKGKVPGVEYRVEKHKAKLYPVATG